MPPPGPFGAQGRVRPAVRPVARRVERYRPDFLMKLMGLIVLTTIWRVQDVVPGLSPTRMALLSTALAAVLLVLDTAPIRRFAHLRSPATWLLAALTLQLTLATFASASFGKSRSFMVKDFAWTLVIFVVAAGVIRSVKDLRWLAAVHVAGAGIFSFFVLTRFRAVDYAGRLCCVPYYDANDVSLVLISTIPYALFFLRDALRIKGSRERMWALAALLPIIPVFQLAGSRGGFLGLGVVIVCAMFTYRGIKPGKRMLAPILALGGLLIIGGPAYRKKIATLFAPEKDYNVTEADGRIGMWKSGMGLVRQRPFVGFGPRMFSEAYGRFSTRALELGGVPWRAAHNAYVEIMAETGVPGAVLFAAMLLTSIALCVRYRKRALAPALGTDGQILAMLAQSNAIGLLGFVVGSIFLSSEYLTMPYLMVGWTVAIGKVVRLLEEQARAAQSNNPDVGRRAPLGMGRAPLVRSRSVAVRA